MSAHVPTRISFSTATRERVDALTAELGFPSRSALVEHLIHLGLTEHDRQTALRGGSPPLSSCVLPHRGGVAGELEWRALLLDVLTSEHDHPIQVPCTPHCQRLRAWARAGDALERKQVET